jgi:hypothetical protein
MLDFEQEIVKYKIEDISSITKKLADITVIDLSEYASARDGKTDEDVKKYKSYETFFNQFMVHGDKMVIKYGSTHKLYILCTNYSKAITKRKIINFLKEKQDGIQ